MELQTFGVKKLPWLKNQWNSNYNLTRNVAVLKNGQIQQTNIYISTQYGATGIYKETAMTLSEGNNDIVKCEANLKHSLQRGKTAESKSPSLCQTQNLRHRNFEILQQNVTAKAREIKISQRYSSKKIWPGNLCWLLFQQPGTDFIEEVRTHESIVQSAGKDF